jgi:sigma-E factor negative regulatory protein RseB
MRRALVLAAAMGSVLPLQPPRLRLLPAVGMLLSLSVLGSALMLISPLARAVDDPTRLLERMNRALAQQEFEGTLVYLHGEDLAALRVSHRINNGTPGESLLSLTGPVRALSRHAEGVTCMLPDAAPLTVRSSHSHSRLLRQLPLDFPRLAKHYSIEHLGRFRVAGRDTEVVGVQANDDYRYGYRFYVDEASGLPLKVDLLAENGAAVQQIMFTEIDIEPDVGPDGKTVGAMPASAAGSTDRQDAAESVPVRLPPGFQIVSRETLARDDGHPIEQLVVSDGLASFSVYLEPPIDGALQGQSQLGAVSAAGGRIGDWQVTVVGEIPPLTARMVLENIEPPDGL